ncbi:MAG: 4a-hydroxytetrahydrobiopterin dehydratase [Chthoniobacterales bacterium]|nr:4a-hydroxytetrahydrobiopterin dehydratase [Chthoniobacterales bacterium]
MKPQLIDWEQVQQNLLNIPGWQAEKSPSPHLTRTFTFKNFVESLSFTNEVGNLAEQVNHHPDILIRWNKVTLFLSTHSAKGITQLDFDLASKINSLFSSGSASHSSP